MCSNALTALLKLNHKYNCIIKFQFYLKTFSKVDFLMNKHILALLVVTNCIFIAQGMFGQQCDAAAANYHEKENEKREKERERNVDIEGLEKFKLSDLGFCLRSKHHDKDFIVKFFDNIAVYKESDQSYRIDFNLDGFNSLHLLQDLVKDKIKHSDSLEEFLSIIGIPCSWELNKLLIDCVKDDKGTFFIDVPKSSDDDKDEEDNEFQRRHEELEKHNNQLQVLVSNLYQRLEKRKSPLALLVPHLCSMSFGFALAVPCCYALYLKMGK